MCVCVLARTGTSTVWLYIYCLAYAYSSCCWGIYLHTITVAIRMTVFAHGLRALPLQPEQLAAHPCLFAPKGRGKVVPQLFRHFLLGWRRTEAFIAFTSRERTECFLRGVVSTRIPLGGS